MVHEVKSDEEMGGLLVWTCRCCILVLYRELQSHFDFSKRYQCKHEVGNSNTILAASFAIFGSLSFSENEERINIVALTRNNVLIGNDRGQEWYEARGRGRRWIAFGERLAMQLGSDDQGRRQPGCL